MKYKNNGPFFYSRLYLFIEAVFLSSASTDGKNGQLKKLKLGEYFKVLLLCLHKSAKRQLWLT